MNTVASEKQKMAMKKPEGEALRKQIDESLKSYKTSLDEVVRSVECRDAYTFAHRIYRHCEQELLKPDLTEAKKYYNLRTKQITSEALDKLKKCVNY
jgi:hypothetical protein